MSEEQLLFPDLDERVAKFMVEERFEGREPVIILDEVTGHRMKTRSTYIVSGSILTEIFQSRSSNGHYDEVEERWTSAWHARLLLAHLEKEAPGKQPRESLKDEHVHIIP